MRFVKMSANVYVLICGINVAVVEVEGRLAQCKNIYFLVTDQLCFVLYWRHFELFGILCSIVSRVRHDRRFITAIYDSFHGAHLDS